MVDTLYTSSIDGNDGKVEMDRKPLVSYITVTYNSEKTLERTIRSVHACRPYVNCEHIVIDGNSTDNTSSILNKFASEIDTLLIEDDNGIYDAMNKGISLAKGDYICFVNSDDWLIPEGVKKIRHLLLAKHPHIDIVATAALAKDKDIEYSWNPSRLDNLLVFRCPNICHNGIYAHHSVFRRIGSFDSDLRIAADSDWIIRAYRSGASFHLSGAVTVAYAIGGVSSNLKLHAEEMIRVACKNYPKLSSATIRSLFYYLFTWRERRHLFTKRPALSHKQAIRLARLEYPELSATPSIIEAIIKKARAKACGILQQLLNQHSY